MVICNSCGVEIEHIFAQTDATQEITAETSEPDWEIDHEWITYVCPACSEAICDVENFDDAVEYMKETKEGDAPKVFGSPKREKMLIKVLADMASNFGRGSFSGSNTYDTEQRFRVAASKALKDAGYEYREYPQVLQEGTGWHLKKKE